MDCGSRKKKKKTTKQTNEAAITHVAHNLVYEKEAKTQECQG
jgi:hypothetical protein